MRVGFDSFRFLFTVFRMCLQVTEEQSQQWSNEDTPPPLPEVTIIAALSDDEATAIVLRRCAEGLRTVCHDLATLVTRAGDPICGDIIDQLVELAVDFIRIADDADEEEV